MLAAIFSTLPRTLCVCCLLAGSGSFARLATAAPPDDEYLLLVTIDGLRPEEVFTGADERLIDADIGGVDDPNALRARFWDNDPEVRRQKLLPFLWSVVAQQGQLFGDPNAGSSAIVTNGHYFSYPGYQEILCGYPDEAIDSNDKTYNRNVNVLEWLHGQAGFSGGVAAFTSWDVFPYILNEPRGGIAVNAGWSEIEHATTEGRKSLLNQAIRETPHYWAGVRFDFHTAAAAMEYLQVKQPRVLYLAIGETDDWCHAERYDLYLDAARRSDQTLQTFWEYLQRTEPYRGRTSLLVATDHGRGGGREGWKNHGADLPGSEHIWIGVLGPHTPALGVRKQVDVTQGQVAASAALLVGYDFAGAAPRIAPPLPDIRTNAAQILSADGSAPSPSSGSAAKP